jgi:hypothetical protein
MQNNLLLYGLDNYIDVGNGCFLNLTQAVAAGQQNQQGGIDVSPLLHPGTLAVQVESGGFLSRNDVPAVGVPDQVRIEGAVYNLGGQVEVRSGTMLNLTGQDANGYSYWAKAGANPVLLVAEAGSNITAAGKYEIDVGTVQLDALSGTTPPVIDQLDGAGLIFGNANTTNLDISDTTANTPGIVDVGGPVTLAANTTVTMNFSGANNTADLLNVNGGALSLNGTLVLNSLDQQLPTGALNFFADSGTAPSLTGVFASMRNNVEQNSNYIYWVDQSNPNLFTWEVVIQ